MVSLRLSFDLGSSTYVIASCPLLLCFNGTQVGKLAPSTATLDKTTTYIHITVYITATVDGKSTVNLDGNQTIIGSAFMGLVDD